MSAGAVGAQAIDFHGVRHLGVAVLRGGPGGPGFHGGRLHLHGLAAVPAQQVVVVPGDGAPAVDGLAFAVAEHVHQALVGEGLQDPVGGGQGDGDALVLQDPVQLLGADEVVQLVQGGAYRQPLLGDPLFFAASRCRRGQRPAVSAGAVWHEWTRFA